MSDKVLIILTSTVNINPAKYYMYQTDPLSRINTYLYGVRQWLYKTNFKICLVENSGYSFDELNIEKEKFAHRFQIVSYNENTNESTAHMIHNTSKGGSELYAINYAFENCKFVESSDFIIKLTARYFISELEKYLGDFTMNEWESLTQNNRNRCEMVGCHKSNFYDVFNVSLIDEFGAYHSHVEDVWKNRTSKYLRVIVCKEFQIESTIRGGAPDDQPFTTI